MVLLNKINLFLEMNGYGFFIWSSYIVWFILAVTVISIVIHTARMNVPGKAAQIVVLIAALIAVYGVTSWIDRHYL